MKRKLTNLIFDAQIFQTSAEYRGMGQYISELLYELSKNDDIQLTILYSTLLNKTFNKEEIGCLAQRKRGAKVNFVGLPLVGNTDEMSFETNIKKNSDTLEEWIKSEHLESSIFVSGSLFQFELCATFPKSVIKTAIIYDLIPLQHYTTYREKMQWTQYLKQYKHIYSADHLFCISESVSNDLQIFCSIDPSKISVIYGAPVRFKNKKHLPGLTDKFILMPTGNEIRKNNERAIRAFSLFNDLHNNQYSLVITSFFAEEEQRKYKKISNNLIFLGTIDNEELAYCYSKCKALLFPSFYEGLGMPLIEAVTFNKPIAASNIDVFREILGNNYYYFDPKNEYEIADALNQAVSLGISHIQGSFYDKARLKYTWQNTAKLLVNDLNKIKPLLSNDKKTIAVVGPVYSGVSAIGKFIGELHQELSVYFEIDYYYEKSPVDKELRANIMQYIASYQPIEHLTDKKIKKYSAVIYNIGNSNHHTLTAARALSFPDIAIIHDLNLENIYKDMLFRKLIDRNRFFIEETQTNKLTKNASFMYSIARRQKKLVAHSLYAKKILTKFTNSNIVFSNLPIDTPKYYIRNNNKKFTIGMAGIIAGIKGVEVIEKIASDKKFKNDKIKVFGLDFAEPGLLDRLKKLPNLDLITNLTDYDFQDNLRQLDVFVNYRKKYQGEASQATLEAMRYGVPVFVRSDFGWYSELPDDSVVKIENEDEIIPKLVQLKLDVNWRNQVSDKARLTTRDLFTQGHYVNNLIEIINSRE